MSKENKKPVQMTGAEIRRTFGATEVEELENEQQALLSRLNDIYETLRSGSDVENIDELKDKADELRQQIKETNAKLREERKKYGEIMGGAKEVRTDV